jgi:hypothetical protein
MNNKTFNPASSIVSTPPKDNNYMIIGSVICVFFLLGGGISLSFNPGTSLINPPINKGGGNKFIDYGE